MKPVLNYSFETKCRRCGSITAWHLGEEAQWDRTSVLEWGNGQMCKPIVCTCKTCNKETIQDLVYFDQYPVAQPEGIINFRKK